MKIQTNAGEVELTAEMVCRGMVFAPKDPRDYCLGEGRVFVVGRRDDANGIWRDARNENLGTNVLGADRLLGCDPAYASRADCERFGVHGDAAAHGFARLRGGGAVDLRKEAPEGSVYEHVSGRGSRWTTGATVPFTDKMRFVGLDARHARPEDVERLCCGAQIAAGHRAHRMTRCTLAIGDHDDHEDLATGLKWPAKEYWILSPSALGLLASRTVKGSVPPEEAQRIEDDLLREVARAERPNRCDEVCPPHLARAGERCEDTKGHAHWHTLTARDGRAAATWTTKGDGFPCEGEFIAARRADAPSNGHVCAKCGGSTSTGLDARFFAIDGTAVPICKPCSHEVKYGEHAYEIREGRIVEKGLVRRNTPVGFSVGGRARDGGTFPPATEKILREPVRRCRDCNAEPQQHHAAGCATARNAAAALRRNRETQLVALVNACPPDLDPVGWRAAVLACSESFTRLRNEAPHPSEWSAELEAAVRAGVIRAKEGSWFAVALAKGAAAYRRAIAPHTAPPPERRRGGRDARVVLDDGRDE